MHYRRLFDTVNKVVTNRDNLMEFEKRSPTMSDYITLAAVMYQAAGAYDMPVRVLDLLSAASTRESFSHLLNILPVETPVPSVYAFEYTDCYHESAFAVVSLHFSKAAAYKAMVAFQWDKWVNDPMLEPLRGFKKPKQWNPVTHSLFRVREIEVSI